MRDAISQMNPVTLAIVDDDANDRTLFERMFSRSKRLRVIGCYATGEEALKSLAIAEAEVILMDIRMPEMNGITCTRLLKKLLPASTILMVTALDQPEDLRQALLAGAAGFLNKPLTEEECCEAIDYALAGGMPLAKETMRKVISLFGKPAAEAHLTVRQVAVLEGIESGMRNKEIASKLGVSVKGVEKSAREIYVKLDASNRAEAVSHRHARVL